MVKAVANKHLIWESKKVVAQNSSLLNPIALRMAKTLFCSECNRVNKEDFNLFTLDVIPDLDLLMIATD